MGDLRLTKEQREMFAAMARDRHGPFSRLTFYASFIVPFLAFAIYGTLKRDFVAVLIAFGGLLFFVLWRIGSELGRLEAYKDACRKVIEHEDQGKSA